MRNRKELTEDELIRFFKETEMAKDLRSEAMFKLTYHLALRVSELVNLKLDSLTDEGETFSVMVKRVKNGIDKALDLSKSDTKLLRRYLKARMDVDNPYLFPSKRNPSQAVTRNGVQKSFRKYALKAGIEHWLNDKGKPELGVHSLRHSHGVHCALRGIDPLTIKRRMGHKRIESTMVYVETARDKELQQNVSNGFKV